MVMNGKTVELEIRNPHFDCLPLSLRYRDQAHGELRHSQVHMSSISTSSRSACVVTYLGRALIVINYFIWLGFLIFPRIIGKKYFSLMRMSNFFNREKWLYM